MSSPAAMLKDLPLWTGLNREIDALRFAPTAKPLALPNSLLDKTVTVDSSFSASVRKAFSPFLILPTAKYSARPAH